MSLPVPIYAFSLCAADPPRDRTVPQKPPGIDEATNHEVRGTSKIPNGVPGRK